MFLPLLGASLLADAFGFGGEQSHNETPAAHYSGPGAAWNAASGKAAPKATKAAPVVKSLFGLQAQPQAQPAQQQPMMPPMMGMGQMGMQQGVGRGMQGGMGMQGRMGQQPQFQQWLQGGQRQSRQGMLRPEQMVRQDW